MAITCPNCQAQYDVTLFQFGKTIQCDCGQTVRLEEGHVIRIDGPEHRSRRPPRPSDVQPFVRDRGRQHPE